jgi:EAL and modified HD-GYP domain-containing signal transduction protein
MLLSDAIELLPCDKIVLELLETIRLTPAVVQRCRDLQQDGFALALDDVGTLSPEQRSVLEFVDIVKVDVKTLSTAALAATTAELRQYPARLLAEKVDTREQARHCMDLGYSLFQGYYFARPTVISGRKLSHSEMSLLRLLGLLLNDADTRALEGMFKQEPGLSVNLLRLANSAGIAAHGNIASLRTAITLLGRRQLTRWLQILLFSNAAVKRPLRSPLLQLAATRGRFLELLAAQLAPGDQQLEDEAFMTGIMSLMPALLGVTMESIVAQLNVGGEVAQALERRAGRLGILLRLAESLEQEELDACGELLDLLPGLTPHQVTAAETQALAWANAIGQTDAA